MTVKAIVFTPDGRRLISGSRDHHLIFWNTSDWTVERRIGAHDTVQDVSLSRDGRFLASGGDDGHTKVWDVESGEMVSDFHGHNLAVLATALSDDGRFLAAGGYDQHVTVWDRANGNTQAHFRTRPIWSIRFLSEDFLIAMGTQDGELETYDISQSDVSRLVRAIDGHRGGIRSFQLLTQPARLVTTSDDNTIRINSGLGSKMGSRRPGELTRHLAISPDGNQIAVGQLAGLVSVLDREGQLEIRTEWDSPTVSKLRYRPDGELIVVVLDDTSKRIRIKRNVTTDSQAETVVEHDQTVRRFWISGDAELLASFTEDGTLYIWNVSDGSLRLQHPNADAQDVCFSPGNRAVAVAASHGKAIEIDPGTGDSKVIMTAPGMNFVRIRYDPTGRYVALGCADGLAGRVLLLDLQKGESAAEFQVPAPVFCLEFSPSGRNLAVATTDIRLFDVESREYLLRFSKVSNHGVGFESLAFSALGDCLVASHDRPDGSSMLHIRDTTDPASGLTEVMKPNPLQSRDSARLP